MEKYIVEQASNTHDSQGGQGCVHHRSHLPSGRKESLTETCTGMGRFNSTTSLIKFNLQSKIRTQEFAYLKCDRDLQVNVMSFQCQSPHFPESQPIRHSDSVTSTRGFLSQLY